MAGKKMHLSHDGSPVGFRKPPAEHQFKKGDKRPPGSGRKKGVKNARTIIERMLAEIVTATVAGKRQRMTKKELLIRHAFDQAVLGRISEKEAFVRMIERMAPDSIDPPEPLQVQSIPGDEGL